MKTQGTVMKKSRFQIDKLEDRIAPSTAIVVGTHTASAYGSVTSYTSVTHNSTTAVGPAYAYSSSYVNNYSST